MPSAPPAAMSRFIVPPETSCKFSFRVVSTSNWKLPAGAGTPTLSVVTPSFAAAEVCVSAEEALLDAAAPDAPQAVSIAMQRPMAVPFRNRFFFMSWSSLKCLVRLFFMAVHRCGLSLSLLYRVLVRLSTVFLNPFLPLLQVCLFFLSFLPSFSVFLVVLLDFLIILHK